MGKRFRWSLRNLDLRKERAFMRKLTRVVTVVLVISSVVIEWLFLTGSPPSRQALADAFLPAAPAAPVQYIRPDFQTGVVFPRWGMNAYTASDPNYGIG